MCFNKLKHYWGRKSETILLVFVSVARKYFFFLSFFVKKNEEEKGNPRWLHEDV